jgi:hypothetical protein
MPGRRLRLFFSTPPIRTMSRAKISNGAKASGASIICGHVYVSDWPGVIKAVDEAGGVAKYVGDLAPEVNESVPVRGYIATWTSKLLAIRGDRWFPFLLGKGDQQCRANRLFSMARIGCVGFAAGNSLADPAQAEARCIRPNIELQAAIHRFRAETDANPSPFAWTAHFAPHHRRPRNAGSAC